jgi:hypothetical protein
MCPSSPGEKRENCSSSGRSRDVRRENALAVAVASRSRRSRGVRAFAE